MDQTVLVFKIFLFMCLTKKTNSNMDEVQYDISVTTQLFFYQ